MAKKPEIPCSKCDNTLSLGGASPSAVKAHGSKLAVLEGMAAMIGWTRIANGWVCTRHA
ncbi:MAG: hypothetical protein WA940_00235 [Sphingopyxis sp.]